MRRRLLTAAIEAYHDMFARPDGRIPATFEIITLTGWAPHESQQQPLKAGQRKGKDWRTHCETSEQQRGRESRTPGSWNPRNESRFKG